MTARRPSPGDEASELADPAADPAANHAGAADGMPDEAAGPDAGSAAVHTPGGSAPAKAGPADLPDGRPAGSPASSERSASPAGAPDARVPRLLQQAAAWAWRLLLVGVVIYFAFKTASALRLVVLPFIAALLLTALLEPLTARLRRAGLRPLAATWCTVLVAVAVLAGLGMLVYFRVTAEYPTLSAEVTRTARELQHELAGPPFHLNSARLQHYSNQLGKFLLQHKSDIAGTVLTGGKIVLELITGLVLMIFITFFLLKDGRRIWSFLVSGLRPDARARADRAGDAAWLALVSYLRGTTAVAAIHAVVIGLALWLLGVPLLVPLVILVFLAAFVPLIGILVVGALATLVTLATKGWIAAVILVAVFVLENQVEGHLLQPLVVGRLVRLHPLAIILALAVGGIIAGVPGAIVAVPAAAVAFYAWPFLRNPPDNEPPSDGE